jgi:hypothetical protein
LNKTPRRPKRKLKSKLILLETRHMSLERTSRKEPKKLPIRPTNGPRTPKKKPRNRPRKSVKRLKSSARI